jgi:phosphoglycerate dehydrogenase-like enzyme
MTKLLIFLTLPEPVRRQYHEKLERKYPDIVIRSSGSYDEVEKEIIDADILVTFGVMMRDSLLRNAKALKWVHALGTGVDGIVDSPSLSRGVVITSTRGIHGVPMSEMAFLLMLALSRNFPRTVQNQKQHRWERWPAKLLDKKQIGILGVGLIAEELAPRCKSFGMTVTGISETERIVPGIDRFVHRSSLNDVVSILDYLIVLLPYQEATHNLVNAETFKSMKSDAYLINIARGGVVNEDALVNALNSNQIAGAALDTFVDEPLPKEHPLWSTPNTIITPHLGGFNDAYVNDALPQFETNLRHFLRGNYKQMINLEPR